ncbi:MAG: mycofactocin biosynthesis peptidyl-dipeptidase MftE, partial [Acidimicrobiia bacterium]|nr:mycofactocin biosynthesis peptidyl-dipeptidase MftE [Acidimicrobiia bacterium]
MGSAAGNGADPPLDRRSAGFELGFTTSPSVGRDVGDLPVGHPPDGRQRIRYLLVPLGATEQHGPHLPLATDTIIAAAWATAVAARIDGAVAAPALPYGSSGEHEGFPGTLSIGRDALERVIVELVRSAARFCDQVMFVSGHGGNSPVLEPTVARMIAEGHRVAWVSPRWPAGVDVDAHAGLTETSLLLHLQPDLVGPFAAVEGTTDPLPELMPTLRTGGLAAVSDNGVLGDPRRATAEHGAVLFEHLVD